MESQHPDLQWRCGDVPVACRFDDPYFSLQDGLAETNHVFLAGNDLPQRFHAGFQVAELGFGSGLNFLATWAAWRYAGIGGAFRFTTFEAYPMKPEDTARALSAFPQLEDLAEVLVSALSSGERHLSFDDATLDLIIGDARETLPHWGGSADAWFLDGFSPAKNPELWEPKLMAEVAYHTVKGGTLATYTAAGFVRRSLQHAGFEVSRVPGYGRKRHMTRAVLK